MRHLCGRNPKKFYLYNKSIFFVCLFLIIQQSIVATSTIWITSLISSLQLGNFSYSLLGLYLASLFLPYLPGGLALIEMAKAKSWVNVNFLNHFAKTFHGQLFKWTNQSEHSTTSSIITAEAPQTLNTYLDYIYRFSACALNVGLNLVVLALIIEPWLIASYLVGVFFAFFILKKQKRSKRKLALKSQQSRIKWTGMLLHAWDNILLNNKYSFNIWKNRIDRRGQRLIYTSVGLEIFSQVISISMAFALLLPTFALILYLPIIKNYNLVTLAITVVALPRLFQVLSYSYEMLFLLSDLPMQNAKLKTLLKLLDRSNISNSETIRTKLEERIQWDKIKIASTSKVISSSDLLTSIPKSGRFTIKGENGSGKSSFLLLLKHINEGDAFYLPAKHTLAFKSQKKGASTGQQVRETLEELLKNLECSCLLLDEWDANLDSTNLEKLSNLIERLAEKKCVIEVRHR